MYCDFYFTTTSRDYTSYTRALEEEIKAHAAEIGKETSFGSIYLGGGTPSLLPLTLTVRILERLRTSFDVEPNAEVTVEANPENVVGPEGIAYLKGLREMGVTRLSLGVQSFYDDDLKFMNRAHSAIHAEEAVSNVAQAGFDSFSVDLIFGLPEQPFEIWGANLEKALRLGAPHLSCYSLTVEERTPLHKMVQRGMVLATPDEELRQRFVFTADYLRERGFSHYEVSSHAMPGHESRHNTAYWKHETYIGFGPGAHSFVRRSNASAVRWSNTTPLGRWQALLEQRHIPIAEQDQLGIDELADEALMLGLRRLDVGLDVSDLQNRYGLDLLGDHAAVLAEMERAGLIHPIRNDRLRLTTEGAAVADSVALRLLGAGS
ncbi:radical SAM family heme chaperone HemW [soil metagenome]